MTSRTDLAVECLDFAKEIMPKGIEKSVETKNGLNVIRVKVTDEESANIIGKPIGEYITIDTSDFKAPSDNFDTEVRTVAEILSSVIKTDERGVLVVGLGNQDITPDALGPKTVDYIFVSRHIDKDLQDKIGLTGISSVSAIATGVLGQTGIETAEIVASLTKSINPSCVIVIDALASKSIDRLATTIQISNAGICPGSGVQNKRKELSEKTLGVPVISMGVPMVVDMTTVAYDMLGEGVSDKVSEKGKTMMVTPREIDLAIEHAAKMVAFSINVALQPTLSLEDLYALAG